MQLEMTEFNFKDMVKEAIETVEVLQPDYRIVVKGNADVLVQGDRYRLIQVITNYLSNGIKYSKGSREVELTMQHEGKTITVSVKDKGLGISKEQLPYIFNRFFRAEKTKNLEGVGLGLYLCRQIIKAHKGNVWAESEEGKGSTFYFSIPL
jgi:signal transduction histidine kinase